MACSFPNASPTCSGGRVRAGRVLRGLRQLRRQRGQRMRDAHHRRSRQLRRLRHPLRVGLGLLRRARASSTCAPAPLMTCARRLRRHQHEPHALRRLRTPVRGRRQRHPRVRHERVHRRRVQHGLRRLRHGGHQRLRGEQQHRRGQLRRLPRRLQPHQRHALVRERRVRHRVQRGLRQLRRRRLRRLRDGDGHRPPQLRTLRQHLRAPQRHGDLRGGRVRRGAAAPRATPTATATRPTAARPSTATDEANCGRCGAACPDGSVLRRERVHDGLRPPPLGLRDALRQHSPPTRPTAAPAAACAPRATCARSGAAWCLRPRTTPAARRRRSTSRRARASRSRST